MKLLIILCTPIFLFSCATRQRCADKYPCPVIKDTLWKEKLVTKTVEIHDTVLKTDTVGMVLTPAEVKDLPVNRWVSPKQDKQTKSQLKVLKDSLGNLYIECSGKDEIIQRQRERITELERSKEKITASIQPPKKTHLNHWLIFIAGAIVGGGAVVAVVYYLNKFLSIFRA